ncbi:MAG: choice-of-anchor L domain-containing protein [Bacteroidota bacterium]
MNTIKIKFLHFFLISIFFFFNFNTSVFAQLTLTSGAAITPQQLVQTILLGNGVTVSNVQFNGSILAPTASNQIASFTTGGIPTNLGFPAGIVMCSGAYASVTNGAITTAITGTQITTVPELTQYAGTSAIHDAAILEFDFLPLSDTIKFRYAFASNEYPNFVCSSYNDIFGFFITGLNPNGPNYVGTNIALIPGTNNPVSINSVNGGISAGSATPCILTNTQYYHTPIANITYHGLTTVLTAKAVVVPCTPYHIKLAIADLGDNAYDSGVFLEANSFSSNAVTISTSYTGVNPSINAMPMAIESCNNAIVKFTIPLVKTDTTFFPLIISGTATNGVDYQQIPNVVFIPPGQVSSILKIIPIQDYITEPIETISIKVDDTTITTCAIIGDSILIKILSRDTFSLIPSFDTMLCQTFLPAPAYSVPVSVVATGGSGTLKYTWSPAAELSSDTIYNPISTPSVTTVYVVNVNDATGCPGATSSLTVTVNHSPDVSFTSTPFLPAFGCAPLSISFNDETVPDVANRVWDFGDGSSSGDPNPIHVYNTPGVYSLLLSVVTNGGCKGAFAQSNAVTIYSQPLADFTWNPPIGTRLNPLINFLNLTTPLDTSFKWHWDFGDGTSDILKNPSHTYPSIPDEKDYTVTLIATSNFGCNDTVTYTNVKIIDDLLVFPNIITPNGDGINDKYEIGALIRGGGFIETQLLIYNRWGKKVYENLNYQNDFGGEGLPDGVYFVTIKARGILKDVEYKSSLQILR